MTVFWDWNGTLLDDMQVCLDIMDRILARRGLKPIGALERYRKIFTFPVKDYYALAGLDLTGEDFLDLDCSLVPGAWKTLKALNNMGARQILASASRQDDLERQVRAHGLDGAFSAVLGMSDDLGGGKAGLAAGYMRREGIEPADALFVGDTVHDFEVAQSIGCRCVLIAGGHQSVERLEATGTAVLDSIADLPGYLKSLEG